ncbi:MAG: PD40 domain-containing protein [Acidobacteria bacterium]|nr:PD40 domain-containing protein [Acidobacteriota bacterium]
MKTTLIGILTIVLAVAVLGAGDKQAQDVERLLKAAMNTELVDGNLKAAIEQYKKVALSGNRPLAAQALLRMAACYQKLGDAESRKIYERLVREFADQKDAVAEARARLAALQPPAPARVTQTARLVWTGQDAFGAVRGAPSPDGHYLTFLHLGTFGLAVRDLREGTNRVLTKGSGSPWYSVFSPDGGQVAYGWTWGSGNVYHADVRILPLNGGEAQPRVVYQNEEIRQIRPFGWTPDGKELLVLRSLKDGTNQIAMVSVQDGSIRVLKSLSWDYTTMSLSPDGRYIAYDALSGDNKSPTEISVLAADGSRETPAVQGPAGNGSPLWSHDGSQILFLSDRTGNISLWRVPMEGGTPKGPAELVKADIGRVGLKGITRNGTLYYLVSGVFRTNVYIAELDAAMKVTKPPVLATERFLNSNSAPAWSPDGESLAYLSSRGPRGASSSTTVLVIRTLKTGEERDLSLPQGFQTGNLAPSPRWFPDGRSVLVLGPAGKGAAFYRVDLASGKAELLLAPKGAFGQGGLGANAVSRDGKTIFYIASVDDPPTGERKLVRFDIDSRRETVLKSGSFNSPAISPDGTQLRRAERPLASSSRRGRTRADWYLDDRSTHVSARAPRRPPDHIRGIRNRRQRSLGPGELPA